MQLSSHLIKNAKMVVSKEHHQLLLRQFYGKLEKSIGSQLGWVTLKEKL
jgi:hypothetical protein